MAQRKSSFSRTGTCRSLLSSSNKTNTNTTYSSPRARAINVEEKIIRRKQLQQELSIYSTRKKSFESSNQTPVTKAFLSMKIEYI